MNNIGLVGLLSIVALGGCSGESSEAGTNQDGGGGGSSEAGLDASGGATPDADTPDGDTQDGTAADADASIGDPLSEQIAEQQCELLARCAQMQFDVGYGDEASCVAQLKAASDIELTAPGVVTTGEDWLACATEMNSATTCEEYFLRAYYEDPPFTSCDLPAGTLPDGAACITRLQCESGFCDTGGAMSPTCGTCQPPSYSTCSNGLKCAPDERCWVPSGASEDECVKTADVGESCENAPCRDGASCDNGVCPAPVFGTEGDPCDPSANPGYRYFFSWGCAPNNYYCNPDSDTCEHVPAAAAPGESCADDNMWGAMCAAGSRCSNGICEPAIEWGEPCTKDRCKYPAKCIEGTCQMPSTDTCQ